MLWLFVDNDDRVVVGYFIDDTVGVGVVRVVVRVDVIVVVVVIWCFMCG